MKLGIIGLGLMGSSMGLALQKYCNDIFIYGYDNDQQNLTYALNHDIIQQELTTADYFLLDILIIAVPVKTTIKVISGVLPYLDLDKVLVTDMGSTKAFVSQQVEDNYSQLDFIGGHPMTGKELSGPQAASADLFKGMSYILINNNQNNAVRSTNCFSVDCYNDTLSKFEKKRDKRGKLQELLLKIGAELIFMDAEKHDQLVALTSHLPHFIAASIINEFIATEEEYPEISALLGQGFRDFTRIAASTPDIWQDIFLTNRHHLIASIDSLIEHMLAFRDLINDQQLEQIEKLLTKAHDRRLTLGENPKKKVKANGF